MHEKMKIFLPGGRKKWVGIADVVIDWERLSFLMGSGGISAPRSPVF